MRRFFSVSFIGGLLIFMTFTANAQSLRDNQAITGHVTDEKGKPLGGATVTAINTFLGTHTDSNGNFTLTGLRAGSYLIECSFIGYQTVTKELGTGGNEVNEIRLEPKAYLTDEVTVNATRAGEQSPVAYSAVTLDRLRKQNTGSDMPYLLSLTPSFVETSEAGNGIGYTGMRIRGTDGNRINVTLDGIPLNDPESQQVFWVDLPDIASSVDNIQIQRGAGTSSNGSGAFGATISLQSATPGTEPFAEISSAAGSFNTFKNTVSAGTGLLNDRFALQVRLSDLVSDGYVSRTGSDHRSAFVSGMYRTKKSMLRMNLILGKEHTGIGWWGVPADSLKTNRRYNPAGEYRADDGSLKYYDNESDNYLQNHIQLIYNRKLSDYLVLNTAFHYTMGKGYYEEYRPEQPYTDYGLAPVQAGDSLYGSTDLIRRKWMSNDFYGLVYSLKYQKNRIEAVVGGAVNMFMGDHFGRIIWMRNAGLTQKDHQWYFNEGKKGEISIYGKVNYTLSDRTSAFVDLQYRSVNYRMTGPDDDFKDLTQKHDFGFLNPKAGIFHSISAHQDTWLSFSVAHREPTRSDFKEAAGDRNSTPKPETLYDAELGYRLGREKSSFTVNLYGMYYKDQLVPTGQLSDVGYSIMTNVEKSYRMGLEFIAAVKPHKLVEWNVNATFSRNRIPGFVEYYTDYNTTDWSSEYKNRNLGNVNIAYSPSVIAGSDLALIPLKKLELHLISKYVGKQYFDNTMNSERTIDPYFVNNVRIDFNPVIKHIDRIELQLLVNNIFNIKYENNAYGGNWFEDGVEKTWSYYFPQAGTSFMTRLLVRF